MTKTENKNDQKFFVNIINIKTWGASEHLKGLPPSEAFRYVFWEKPYVLEWFHKNYMHQYHVAATIAYSKVMSDKVGRTYIPTNDWKRSNLHHIAHWYMFCNLQFPSEVYKRFKDEVEEAATIIRARNLEEDTKWNLSAIGYI